MGVTQINLDDTPERKCTKYGLAHQIPPDLSVRPMCLPSFLGMDNKTMGKNDWID